MVSPVLDEGHTSVEAYFPVSASGKDRWFSYYDVSSSILTYLLKC